MRDFAIVSPRFWTGETGRFLRDNPDARLLALYLITGPSSNMIGLYYLPVPTICHDLKMTPQGASKALQRAFEGGFAAYDETSETVFVYEMARFQIGDSLSPKDNRVKGVEKQALQFRNSKFFNDFLDRYGERFNLDLKGLRSPFEAPSKGSRAHACGSGSGSGSRTGAGTGTGDSLRSCSEPPQAADSEPPVLTFPTVGRGAKEWHLTESKLAEYRESFPGVDVLAEAKKARQWCIDSPTKRKTFAGMPKFLTGWFGRTQDRGGNSGSNQRGGLMDQFQESADEFLRMTGGAK